MRKDGYIETVRLQYLTENVKVIGPSTDGHCITLHDTFLSFLWAYIYSSVVLAPMGGKEISKIENAQARELRKYGISLTHEYSIWNKELMPNPELHGKDQKRLIGVSNAVFLTSVRFILFHEFAHILLGHPFVPLQLRTEENFRKMEVDADNIAIGWTIQNFKPETCFTDKLSLISALNSLSYFPTGFADLIKHPAPEDRIRTCLERLHLDDNDYAWGYATWSIMEWQVNFEPFHIPMTEGSYRDMFFELVSELKEYKVTGSAKLKNEMIRARNRK